MTAIVTHNYNGYAISQDNDGYTCLTDMAKAAGKLVADYLKTDSTQAYLQGLSDDMNIPISSLIRIVQGKGKKQGTWAHPEVAIDFAQWCNVSFRIWANRTLRGVIEQKGEATQLEVLKQTIALREIELEALKIEKGIIAPAPTKNYKVIDLTGIDNIESVEAYIRDRTKINPEAKVYIGKANGDSTKLMYPNYLEYCQEHELGFVTVQRFSRILMQLVYATLQVKLVKKRDSNGNHVKGIEVLA